MTLCSFVDRHTHFGTSHGWLQIHLCMTQTHNAWQEVHLHELVHLCATCLWFCLLGLIHFNAHIIADEVYYNSWQCTRTGTWFMRSNLPHEKAVFLSKLLGICGPILRTTSEMKVGSTMVTKWYSFCNMWTETFQHPCRVGDMTGWMNQHNISEARFAVSALLGSFWHHWYCQNIKFCCIFIFQFYLQVCFP